ncbi:MAG: tRNA (adenosine(37)-N6)-dimethylallyltransferase MiaA [Nitriliruptoraceae bacterium]|nr:tRNA (adenosine(37)-N6)-dimethylallyltransferase MiaA [Nitriliruptoraceae bacterium]
MEPILAILGPTASGKSACALDVADQLVRAGHRVELIAVDAFTIYRGMDVGTAKPTPTDRARHRHHLVDVLDPSEEVTVAWFQQQARAVIARCRTDGIVPLLVGGSGLYWRAVVDDLRFPPTDERVRADLEARYAGDAAVAHQHLVATDPEAAANIAPENLRRTIRALEVQELTGERFSAFQRGWDRPAPGLEHVHTVFLDPPTVTLRAAIADRAARMVAGGLLEEAVTLRGAGRLSRTAAQAIGYAEALAVLDDQAPLEGLAERITTRTWRYAKRQRSWFRADRRYAPVEPGQARTRLLATVAEA